MSDKPETTQPIIFNTHDIVCPKGHTYPAPNGKNNPYECPICTRNKFLNVDDAMTKITPTKQRDAARIALAKSVVAQLTALNRTHAQAKIAGVRIDFSLTGADHTPEIKNAYYVQPSGNVINIWEEVFK